MASVVKRTRKDGSPSYYVKYLAGDGRQRWERVAAGAKAARARKAEVELELAKTGGRWVPPASVRFDSYARQWLEAYAKPATRARVYDGYRRAIENTWVPAFGSIELAAITRAQVKAVVAEKEKTNARATIRNHLVPLRELLGHAVEDSLLHANPAAGIRIAKTTRTRKIVPPTREQVEKVIAKVRPEAQDALIVATSTGVRRGELFALKWKDVDFDAGTIHVHASNFGAVVEETTKTEAGERHVPLFRSARKVLAARKLRTSPYDRPDDFVFATSIGTPMEPNSFVRREWRPALVRAGLGEWVEEDGRRVWKGEFTWHSLRHYAVSALIAAGADIKLLQSIAGHASAVMTLDRYGHLMTDRVTEAAELYDPLKEASGV